MNRDPVPYWLYAVALVVVTRHSPAHLQSRPILDGTTAHGFAPETPETNTVWHRAVWVLEQAGKYGVARECVE